VVIREPNIVEIVDPGDGTGIEPPPNVSYTIEANYSVSGSATKNYSKDPTNPIVLDYFTVACKQASFLPQLKVFKLGTLSPDSSGTLRGAQEVLGKLVFDADRRGA